MFLALGFATPTPALASELPAPIYASTTSEDIIRSYAIHYGIVGDVFLRVAKCESSLNKDAFNKTDGVGGSRGVFQFQTATFNRYKKAAGVPNGDVWNPFDNIQVAAYMFSIHEEHQWSCYPKQAETAPYL